ncbi:hypothetical protein [Vibrio japonicus]|uniref:MotA/TolQ/ExbB proton channel domain-containing protein n=1 Tax=Vibrio japonicus TaxID=1824638 RepID=A0ABY5LK54_9VIBR|nr:hypothetical protein [Vibrio japonicus]UUM32236.1 hypothetical protein NP165_18290 [Vibrio japonicus]
MKFISQLAFFAGCLFGISTVVTGYKYLELSQDMGLMTMLTGVVAILSAIAFLGLINGFLSIVKTQIETRNAIIELVEATKNKSMKD